MDAFHFRVPTPSTPTYAEHHRPTLQDVNIDLPDKKELVLYAHMSPIQRDYYRLAEVRACVRACVHCLLASFPSCSVNIRISMHCTRPPVLPSVAASARRRTQHNSSSHAHLFLQTQKKQAGQLREALLHQGVPDADAIKQTNPQMLLRKVPT